MGREDRQIVERLCLSLQGKRVKKSGDEESKRQVPTANMIPRDFKVSLLKNTTDYVGSVYSSKGVGEPGFYQAVSVYYAIVEAINAGLMNL